MVLLLGFPQLHILPRKLSPDFLDVRFVLFRLFLHFLQGIGNCRKLFFQLFNVFFPVLFVGLGFENPGVQLRFSYGYLL